MNLEGDTLYCKIIEEGCASVSITKSHDDAYELFEVVDQDDTAVTRVGQALSYFVLWPTEFLHPTKTPP
jgi:hypothetical protein